MKRAQLRVLAMARLRRNREPTVVVREFNDVL
jgi:hypothetical protein